MTRTATDNAPAGSRRRPLAGRDLTRLAIPALVLATLPGLGPFLDHHVLAKPHYQFVLIIPLILGCIVRGRLPGHRPLCSGHPLVTAALLVAWGALLAGSTLGGSSVLWALGVAAGVMALAWDHGGPALLRAVGPGWGLVILSIPLPLGFDKVLIFRLQMLATSLASTLLDGLLGLPHLRDGNVIHLRETSLMVAEACSGVNSLFATLALTLAVLALVRRPWIHAMMLLGGAVVTDLTLNALRIVGIALGHDASPSLGRSLESGWMHDALSLATIPILLLVLASLDAVVRLGRHLILTAFPCWVDHLLDPQSHDTGTPDPEDFPYGGPTRIGFPGLAGRLSLDPGTAPPDDPGAVPYRGPLLARRLPAVALLCGASLVGGLGLVGLLRTGGDGPALLDLPVTGETLPVSWQGWTRVDHATHDRGTDFVYARRTRSWQYRRDDRHLEVLLHDTYRGWHPFELCYEGIGWRVSQLREGLLPTDRATIPFVTFLIAKEGQPPRRVAYTLYDPGRRIAPPPMNTTGRTWDLWSRLRARISSASEQMVTAGLVIQVTPSPEDPAGSGDEVEALLGAAHAAIFAGEGDRR